MTVRLGSDLNEGMSRLSHEAWTVYQQIVLPNWGRPALRCPETLYGYMMAVFARIDLFSGLWRGSEAAQSVRMIEFLAHYMGVNRQTASVAVQVWRHKLMHTSRPRQLLETSTGIEYRWLLHWYDHLPRDQHFTFAEAPRMRILNLALLYLIEDLGTALTRYLADVRQDPILEANYIRAVNALSTYTLRAI